MKRGVYGVLAAALAWSAPLALGDAIVAADDENSLGDVYVCIDPSTESPGVYLSATDCASGAPDTATFTFYDANTGTEIIVHLKSCLTQTCIHRTCVTNPCDPECVSNFLCVQTRCMVSVCSRSCVALFACFDTFESRFIR